MRLNKEHVRNWNEQVSLTVHEPYIRVEIDKLLQRKLPIEALLQGVPAGQLHRRKDSVEPTEVTVSGLQADIAKLQKIQLCLSI